MANLLDYNIVVTKFWSQYYIHFWTNALEKSMNSFIPLAVSEIIPLSFFSKRKALVLNNPHKFICH